MLEHILLPADIRKVLDEAKASGVGDRLYVTRTIVIFGDSAWVEMILSRCFAPGPGIGGIRTGKDGRSGVSCTAMKAERTL